MTVAVRELLLDLITILHIIMHNHVCRKSFSFMQNEWKNKQWFYFRRVCVQFTVKKTKEKNVNQREQKMCRGYCRRAIKNAMVLVVSCFHTRLCSAWVRSHVHTFVEWDWRSVKVICILNLIIRLLLLFQFKLYYMVCVALDRDLLLTW